METKRLHAIVEGHVQGVGFRYFVVEKAQQLKLNGWVRNRDNGDVEVVAEGKTSDLESLDRFLNEGPVGSQVLRVTTDWLTADNSFTRFSVVPTA